MQVRGSVVKVLLGFALLTVSSAGLAQYKLVILVSNHVGAARHEDWIEQTVVPAGLAQLGRHHPVAQRCDH